MAGGVTTAYTYNALDQIKTKTYTDGTPSVSYTYNKSWLTNVSSGQSSYSYTAFDPIGRVTAANQTTNGTSYAFGVQYKPNVVDWIQYPNSGRKLTTAYDSAGRPAKVSGQIGTNPATYYAGDASTNVQYAPHGAIQSMKLGNGITVTTDYNSRLQPTLIQAGSLLTIGYGYSPTQNNGSVGSQTITRSTGTWTDTYTYDGVNRLTAASESGTGSWSQSYGYDSRGNRYLSGYSGLPAPTAEVPQAQSWFGANNRITSWTYDTRGNLTGINGMPRTFTYDAENRMKSATVNGEATTYTYDGDGRRVQKSSAAGTWVYVYDPFGNLAQEYGPSTDSGTKYLTTDALGSTRLVTKADGTVDRNYDYFPFGEEIPSGIGGRDATFPSSAYPHAPNGPSLEFTSKERDAETGLDFFGARYMSSAQGRFTSPDEYTWIGTTDAFTGEPVRQLNPLPYADINDPQSLNKYAYVLNNPLRYTDPDGHCVSGTLDTAICLAAGVAVAKIITDLMEWKNNLDETKAYAEYYNSLLERAMAVCSTGSSECQAALDTAERARLAALKRGVKTAKAAIALPGTFVGGPLPTSRNDLAVSTIQDLLTAPLRKAEDKAQKKNEKTTQNGEPKLGDPIKPHKTCLLDRDGNCIQ